MQGRKIWKYALVVLCFGLTGTAWADETWHVTSGVNGEEHSIWTVTLGEDGNPWVTRIDLIEPDGSTSELRGGGSLYALRVIGMRPHSLFCQFDIKEIADGKASGTEECSSNMGDVLPWSATIDAQQ